jgi:hypothetical protein
LANPYIDFRFDGKTPEAVKAAEESAAKMIKDITEETEQNIRNLIASAIRDGIPPYDAARMISSMIGLTAKQGQAAMKYREQLIEDGLSLDTVNEKVDEYSDKLLSDRGETIARTEIMDALNNGQDVVWQQAQDEGLLSKNATKEWIVTPDDALCPQCEAYDGETVPIGDDFEDGDPPLHPNCRCTIAIGEP